MLVLCGAIFSCSDPVERNIARLVEGGEDAAEARLELNLAKSTAIGPLIEALQNEAYPPRARADIVESLYRLYIREADPRIWDALIGALEDANAIVRTAAVRALGDMGREAGIGPLVELLDREASDVVRGEILLSLEAMSTSGGAFSAEVRVGKFAAEDKERFAGVLARIQGEAVPDSLRLKVLDWLEILAEDKAIAARNLMLQANLHDAEALLLSAWDLVPDSKNINYALGRFYYDNGQVDKGLAILEEWGLLMRVPRLAQRPAIDGSLDELAWGEVIPIREFYQCIPRMRAYPVEGETEIRIGYRDNRLYIGVKGYEPATDNLAAKATRRDDGNVWRDDCVEMQLDTDHDYSSYVHININSRGAVDDYFRASTVSGGVGDIGWSGEYAVATRVEETFWTLELEIPADQLHQSTIAKGGIWGFNIARVRIANAAEYGQWVPTYGLSMRPDRFGFLVFE